MKTTWLLWFVVAGALSGCAARRAQTEVEEMARVSGAASALTSQHAPVVVADPEVQMALLPEGLAPLYIGMPYEAFTFARPIDGMEVSELIEFRLELTEKGVGPHGAEVIYYFDRDVPLMPLYEMIVEFPPGFDVAAEAARLYGPPNAGTEWTKESGGSFPLRIWIFAQKIVIAGVIPGTEWVDEE